MFLENGFLKSVDLAEVTVALFDLHFIYASIFYYDTDGAHDAAEELITQSMSILNFVSENIQAFEGKKELFERGFVKNVFLRDRVFKKCVDLDRENKTTITK